MKNNQDNNIEKMRHSCAHLLAAAVLELYPDTKATIGPFIENGFYYDFDFRNQKISEEGLPKIEEKMHQLVKTWDKMEMKEVTEAEARELFSKNEYKLQLIDDFKKEKQQLTICISGNFTDLCRGGHIDNPSKELQYFKLLSIAGAYWKGNEKNQMLTRIYGTCFPSQKELDEHLKMLEEAKKRDHKKLGKELDLFVFSSLVGSGLPLWTPKGTIIREELDDLIWSIRKKFGYQRVAIPHITKKDLYEVSGHWEKFSEELFKIQTREGHLFAMKPMNCPHHIQIYSSQPRSYRELPVRYTETTMVYRDEQSGELAGLSRVRAITQDDAHVFLRKSQIKHEFLKTWDIVDQFYSSFGFELRVRLSLHDPKQMDKYLGEPEIWKFAEDELREVVLARHAKADEGIGEAAMYGPKIDFMARDSLGREWQVATIQLDLNMPKRFGLTCINEDGKDEDIVMLHCAVMGSIERFTSVLIEHYAGAFPLWLSPVQIVIIPIADRHKEGALKIADELKENEIRVEIDDRSESMQSKIRDHSLQKVPYLGIIGDKELASNNKAVSIRTRDGKDLGQITFSNLLEKLKNEIDKKT